MRLLMFKNYINLIIMFYDKLKYFKLHVVTLLQYGLYINLHTLCFNLKLFLIISHILK